MNTHILGGIWDQGMTKQDSEFCSAPAMGRQESYSVWQYPRISPNFAPCGEKYHFQEVLDRQMHQGSPRRLGKKTQNQGNVLCIEGRLRDEDVGADPLKGYFGKGSFCDCQASATSSLVDNNIDECGNDRRRL